MRRPHTLTILAIALIITILTFFIPPLFSLGEGIERGFPFPWAFQADLPGSGIPFIGWFVSLIEVATLTFKWQWLLADVAVYCTILFMIFNTFSNEAGEKVEK